MKKSKYINLVLITVSLAAVAKASNAASATTEASNYAAIELASNTNMLQGVYQQLSFHNENITRGGFGDDKHSGAEQHHDDKK